MSDNAARTADGRLFHARGAATENDRSPRVDQSCCVRRAQVTAALDVNYPADTVSEVGRSFAVETAERQNTEAEPYPLWDAQPVKIAQERGDAFRTPR